MISFLLYAAIMFGSLLALLCLIAGIVGFVSGIIHSIRLLYVRQDCLHRLWILPRAGWRVVQRQAGTIHHQDAIHP